MNMQPFNFADITSIDIKEDFGRKRIDLLLDEAMLKPLICVVANTGHGKTVIISNYLSRFNFSVRWVTMQKLDNINTRFWFHFIDSLFNNNFINDNVDIVNRFKSLGFPNTLAAFDQFLNMLSEIIPINDKFIIVFDNLYLIEEEEISLFIQKLAEAKLLNLTIIVCLRNMANFKFNKSKFNNIAAIINEDTIRYTTIEVHENFNSKGLGLSNAQIKNIYDYTGGWAIAVYLFKISFYENDLLPENSINNAKTNILTLIDKKVFSPCSYKLQNLLIKLSLLNNFPFELLNEIIISSNDNPNELLQEMLNSSLLIRFDSYTREYFIHNVLLDFLIERQSILTNDEIIEVNLISGNWYRKNGYNIDALNSYQKCNEYDKILEILIEQKSRCSEKLANVFVETINKLPNEFVINNPIVKPLKAKFMLNNAKILEGTSYISVVANEFEELLKIDNKNVLLKEALGETYIISGLLNFMIRSLKFLVFFKMANQYLPNGSKIFDKTTELNGGNIVLSIDHPVKDEFKNAVGVLYLAVDNITKVMNGCGMGIEHLGSTEMFYNMGDLKNAEKNAFQAIYKAQQTEQKDIEIMAYFFLLRINIARGNYDEANYYVSILKSQSNEKQSPICLRMIDVALSWFYAAVEDVEKMNNWIINSSENDENRESLSPISVGVDLLIRGRGLIVLKQYKEIIVFYKANKNLYGLMNFLISKIEIEILKSIAYYNLEDIDESILCLESAYSFAYANKLIIPFVEYGKYIKPVLLISKNKKNCTIPIQWLNDIYIECDSYSKHLSFCCDKYNISINKDIHNKFILDKFEIEILNELSNGFTKSQIAKKHKLSFNMVNSMINHIYNELGVSNSVEAIKIALSMNLL